jgi:hypothetical protein
MPKYNKKFKLAQSGRESTKGTLVPATQRMMVKEFVLTPRVEAERDQELMKGLLAPGGDELIFRHGVDWSVPETPVVFDQFMAWLAMAFKGGVAPTGVGPYTWTYLRDITADPNVDARTFEVRETDAATPSDWEFGYAMLKKLTVKFAQGQSVRFTAEGFGRKLQTSTLTALSNTAVVQAPNALTKCYIDSTWAGVGGTQVVGQVLGAEFTIETGIDWEETMDARADMDYDHHAVGMPNLSAQIVILTQPSGQWATEKTAAEAGPGGTLRAVQLEAAVSASANLKLQGLFKHDGSVFPDGEQKSQRTATLRLVGTHDGAAMCRAILINNASTMV